MFNNTEEQDNQMVRAVGSAIMDELARQQARRPDQDPDYDRIAITAIVAMVRWAQAHPPPRWFNDNNRPH